MDNSILPKIVPLPSVRRLPAYLNTLQALRGQGREWVSCTHIAELLGQDSAQVRKDLACVGMTGRPKVGYRVDALVTAIQGFLGWDSATDAFLAGAGNLGQALVGYSGFPDSGLNIVAVFDRDPAKIGTEIHGRQVLAIDKLPKLARRMGIRLGIVAVPAPVAQTVAELMVAGGIEAIWNFAPVCLQLPPTVVSEQEDLSRGLAVLSRKLTQRRQPPSSST